MAVLFYLHVVLGGLLLQRGRSWIFLLSLHGALLWLQAANFSFPINEQNAAFILLPHAMVLLFWHCTHFLGQHLDHQQGRLLRATVAAEKQDRLRALGALAAGFSHEFASPLQTIRLKLDRLAKGAGTSEDIAMAKAAVDDCARVLHAMNESQFDVRASSATPVQLPKLLTEIVDRWGNGGG
ncbi:hypothetical protein EON80_32880 [bacterium]|nr:MAG: hypothetical protein EON80_32880 [bacterium]